MLQVMRPKDPLTLTEQSGLMIGLSPTSNGSHDSVIHHDQPILGAPEAYGFKLDFVSSSSPAAAAAEGDAAAGLSDPDLSPNAATAPHPLAYRPHDLPSTTTTTAGEGAAASQEFGALSPASYSSDISSPAVPSAQHHLIFPRTGLGYERRDWRAGLVIWGTYTTTCDTPTGER